MECFVQGDRALAMRQNQAKPTWSQHSRMRGEGVYVFRRKCFIIFFRYRLAAFARWVWNNWRKSSSGTVNIRGENPSCPLLRSKGGDMNLEDLFGQCTCNFLYHVLAVLASKSVRLNLHERNLTSGLRVSESAWGIGNETGERGNGCLYAGDTVFDSRREGTLQSGSCCFFLNGSPKCWVLESGVQDNPVWYMAAFIKVFFYISLYFSYLHLHLASKVLEILMNQLSAVSRKVR